MAQYWLQIPVENAKEVVQRYIDNNAATLDGYVGKTVTYQPDCEVIFYGSDMQAFSADTSAIWFGTYIVTSSNNEMSTILAIQDQNTNSLTTFDCSTGVVAGEYPYLMFNRTAGTPSDTNSYFIGYKFDLV
jgi:hypothetical protein